MRAISAFVQWQKKELKSNRVEGERERAVANGREGDLAHVKNSVQI